MSKEAMKLALEALETERDNYQDWDKEDGAPEYIYEAITALREALAEQPAQRKPLPPSDVVAMWHQARPTHAMNNSFDWYKSGVEDAEAKHGIKENT